MSSPSPTVPVTALQGERVELPSGGWMLLRHLDDLRSSHREEVVKLFPDDSNYTMSVILRIQRKLSEVMIVAWQLPYLPGAALPADQPEILRELTVRDENKLFEKLKPVMDLLNPDQPDPADVDNPDSPTGPSAG